MFRSIASVAILTFLLGPTTVRASDFPGGLDYYVSNSGLDTNPGTLAQPFLTIQKAADVALAGDTVRVRGGTYRETVTTTQSGTAVAPITFKPYQGERVTITGLDEFNGSWTPYQGNIYQSSMGGLPSQMFFNGELVSEARYPAAGQKNPLVATYNNATSGGFTSLTDTNNITQGNNYWDDYQLTFVPGLQYRAYNANINSQAGSTLNYSAIPQASAGDTPYYITGGVKAVVAGRQWVYTPSSDTLYFNAPGNVDPSGQNVEVRTRKQGFDIASSYINVQGFQFKAANIVVNGAGNVIDNVQVLYPSPYGPAEGPPEDRGIDGIRLGGDGNTVRNSEVAYGWVSGIVLAGAPNATIENNLIHDVNWIGSEINSGITSFFSVDATITGNTIYNTGRSGVYNTAESRRITFSNNEISRFGYLAKDMGGFVSHGVGDDSGPSLVSNNVVTDGLVSRIGGNGNATVGGIYLDNDSNEFTVWRNVVTDVTYGIITNTPSDDNTIINNTIWNVLDATRGVGPGGFTNVTTQNNVSNSNEFVGNTVSNNLGTGVDPFVNSAAGDFRLKPGSQPIHLGTPIPGFEQSYAGLGPDAGAFQSYLPAWTAGANFKTFLFADQESVPLVSAVSVKQDDSKLTTGDLLTGNPTETGGMAEFFRTFLDFDLSSVATTANQLESAILRIYQTEVYETQGADSINGGADLFSLDADWDPATGTFSELANSTQIGGTSVWDSDGIELYRDIDVTAAVAAWLANPSSNFGFSLISDLEGTSILSAKYIGGAYNITPPQLILTATQQPGDFDGDGDVDGNDFLTWQRGVASSSDLADWETNFGLSGEALAGAAAVPEPSTWMFTAALLPVLMVRNRRFLERGESFAR